MECLCCYSGSLANSPDAEERRSKVSSSNHTVIARRASVYHIEDAGETDNRHRNAIQLRMQLALTEELTKETYGLEVIKKNDEPYEAQDFFDFKEILGSGATAVVFKAVFKPTGKEYAVKFIPNFKAAKTQVMRELKVLQLAGGSRFLIDFHSHFRVGQSLYFVLEICKGGSLEELIQPKYHLPGKLMKIYIKDISNALFYLHDLKLVHRDVAPPNILIDYNGHLKLGDFGLCRIVDEPQGEIMTDCGKPYTKAPEMYMDKPCSFPMDWWSVGIIVYRFITGKYPFKTEKLTQGYHSVTKHQEKYPEWAFSDTNAKLLCQGLLNKKPKERLSTESAIKAHPYFHNVDWDEEESILRVAMEIMQSTDDPCAIAVVQRLYVCMGSQPPAPRGTLSCHPLYVPRRSREKRSESAFTASGLSVSKHSSFELLVPYEDDLPPLELFRETSV